jgi:H+-translocating NAD(P) transhydrogenase subunit alpha
MIVGVLKEQPGENRVSLVPEIVRQLEKQGVSVWIEPDAGARAYYPDETYTQAGAIIKQQSELIAQADILCSIGLPGPSIMETIPPSKMLIGVYQPLFHVGLMQQWAAAQTTIFSLDNIPRITRAQSMDVLSSQANIAGYKAVLMAATSYSRYFPMFMTAAGSIAPAKVLILGAGVAGLQAIATARRLGAVVEVFDTRPAVKEEVMSLGAKFIDVTGAADASSAGGYAVEQTDDYRQRQEAKIAESVSKADIIITTAQIPGKKAPVLISAEMIEKMRPGGVIVDLAAGTGGNTEVTLPGETILHEGITIIGNTNVPSTMPADASKLYAKNVFNFLQLLLKNGSLTLDMDDEIIRGACITHEGVVTNERLRQPVESSI